MKAALGKINLPEGANSPHYIQAAAGVATTNRHQFRKDVPEPGRTTARSYAACDGRTQHRFPGIRIEELRIASFVIL
jgi:hypothetical protein